MATLGLGVNNTPTTVLHPSLKELSFCLEQTALLSHEQWQRCKRQYLHTFFMGALKRGHASRRVGSRRQRSQPGSLQQFGVAQPTQLKTATLGAELEEQSTGTDPSDSSGGHALLPTVPGNSNLQHSVEQHWVW